MHVYDAGLTLIENLFGRSRFPNDPHLGGFICDCGASYLSSAFALGFIALVGVAIAISVAFANFHKRKLVIPLMCAWAALLGYSFVQDFTNKISRIKEVGPASQYIDKYSRTYLASAPAQVLFDLVLLFVIPAAITCVAMRKARAPTRRG